MCLLLFRWAGLSFLFSITTYHKYLSCYSCSTSFSGPVLFILLCLLLFLLSVWCFFCSFGRFPRFILFLLSLILLLQSPLFLLRLLKRFPLPFFLFPCWLSHLLFCLSGFSSAPPVVCSGLSAMAIASSFPLSLLPPLLSCRCRLLYFLRFLLFFFWVLLLQLRFLSFLLSLLSLRRLFLLGVGSSTFSGPSVFF